MKEKLASFDRRISFIDPVADVENDWGELEPGQKHLVTVWASVEEIRGKEKRRSGKDYATIELEIICRYLKGITPDLIVDYEGRKLEIVSVIELGRRKYLEIVAIEKKTLRGVN